jgi:MoaA/NifB/PqqE/SkfB family radical SAM enzyme
MKSLKEIIVSQLNRHLPGIKLSKKSIDPPENAKLSTKLLPYLGVRYQIEYHSCNLDCPYCIAQWKDKDNLFDNNNYRGIIDKLKELPFRTCLRIGVGGEPFTSQEILDGIIDICNSDSNIFGVSFSTNLVASWSRTIEPFLNSLDTSKLGMGCTLHDTVIKDIDGFFEKLRKIKGKGVLVFVGLVAIPDRIEMIKEYKLRCDKLGIPLIMNGLIGRLVGKEGINSSKEFPQDYSFTELAELKKLWDTPHSYQMLLEGCETKGMVCSAGHNYIYLNHKGDAFPCGNIKTSIGNILQEPIKFQKEDTICPVSTCWCGNENQALRIVDENYDRTRTLRIFSPKPAISKNKLYMGYNPSILHRIPEVND